MSTEPIWYYEREGERHGPVTAAEILDLHRGGSLGPQSLVWREGLGDWVAFAESELAPASGDRPSPPPVPSVLSPATLPPPPLPFEPFTPRQARLRPGFRPRIRASYGRAWELLKSRFWPLVGCFVLASLLFGVAAQLYLPALFLMYPILAGFDWYILRYARGKEVSIDLLFEGFRRQFGPLAIANLIVGGISLAILVVLIVLIALFVAAMASLGLKPEEPGFLLTVVGGSSLLTMVFMIPLTIFGVVGHFAMILILDCEIKAREALSLGWQATKRHLFKFLLFFFVAMALSYAGILALYFGVFITGAWASIALVYLYEDAFGDETAG